jgi:hypothetical protein
MSPARPSGYLCLTVAKEQAVDNFLAKIFFNEINAQPPKSWKS